MEALVAAGFYQSKTEAVRDAIRRMLENLDMRDVAFRAYVSGGITFQFAMHIAREGMKRLAGYFISRGVVPELGVANPDEAMAGVKILWERGVAVLDLSSLEASLESRIAEHMAWDREFTYIIPSRLGDHLRVMPYKSRVLYGINIPPRWATLERAPLLQHHSPAAKKIGATAYELEAIALARRRNAVLVSCDSRTRLLAKLYGVDSAPLQSLILVYVERGVIDREWARLAIDRLASIPMSTVEV